MAFFHRLTCTSFHMATVPATLDNKKALTTQQQQQSNVTNKQMVKCFYCNTQGKERMDGRMDGWEDKGRDGRRKGGEGKRRGRGSKCIGSQYVI